MSSSISLARVLPKQRVAESRKVEDKDEEREEIHDQASEHKEHIASKEHHGDEHEDDEEHEEFLHVALTLILVVPAIGSIRFILGSPVGSKDVVPAEVEGEQGWEQSETHDKSLPMHSSEPSKPKGIIIIVLIWLWLRPYPSRPIRYSTLIS